MARTAGRYELTPLGRSLLGSIELLGRWAHEHADEVLEAQQRAEILGASPASA